MMHLSESELVDLAEDALAPRRAAHLEACASCRAQADALGAVLREAAAVEVPDPSPIFWEEWSARVRAGVAAEPVPVRSARSWPPVSRLVPFGAAAAVAVAVISGALILREGRDDRAPSPIVAEDASAAAARAARPVTAPDADNAAVWEVLTSAASTVGFDEVRAAGMHVHPAAIDHAVQDLSATELTELGRLLQSELKRSSN